MNWAKGFGARFYGAVINPKTWADSDRFEITGGSVQYSTDSLMGSASVDTIAYPYYSENWVRIWMDVVQEGDSAHVPLFTGLAIKSKSSNHGGLETNSLECFSVLKPAEDVLLPRGWNILEGTNVKEAVIDLLSVTHAPIIFESDPPNLSDYLVAEEGETNLSMAELIVAVIGWRMYLTGYGEIYISPKPNKPVSTFNGTDNDILEVDYSQDDDWFSVPNVLRVVLDDQTVIQTDDDPDSFYSIQNRGREIWAEESNVTLNTYETLGDYAARRLRELQSSTSTISYTRRYVPTIHVTDLVEINYPRTDLIGVYQVTSQSIELHGGAKTSEDATHIL